MALAVHRRASNICRTVQLRIGDTVTTAGALVVPVSHSDPHFDPDAAGDDNTSPLQRWAITRWLSVGAGANGNSTLQADVFTRVRAQGDPAGDPFGTVCSEIGDALVEVFSGLNAQGRERWWIEVLDFADPDIPVATGEYLLCQNLGGRDGSPSDRTPVAPEGGFQRQTLRWRFKLIQDAAGPAAFYVE